MRFTKKLVDELMQDVDRFTGGRFKMHPATAGPAPGDGPRYRDYNSDRTWHGADGARDACAYFIGGALGWAQVTGTEIPEDIARHLQSVYEALNPHQRAPWETQGRDWARRLAEDEGKALMPEGGH
jgi:hypothetical protein